MPNIVGIFKCTKYYMHLYTEYVNITTNKPKWRMQGTQLFLNIPDKALDERIKTTHCQLHF